MSLRTSLQKLIRRDPVASLRERATELRGSLNRRTVVAGTVAAAVPLPALAATVAPAAVPSDLARACDAAVAHLAWINNPAHPDDAWPDERLEAELDKAEDVVWRAANEPAASLDDLSAKARLLIADSGQHLGWSKFAGDRATLTLLREVTALAPTRALPPAPMAVAPVERAEYRARLLAAYAEDRAQRPISNVAQFGSIEERAAALVGKRLWSTAREILALPPPATTEGLTLTALAATILTEAEFTNDDPAITAAVSLTRAVLAFTGAAYPDGFIGFGDEPDHSDRDKALYTSAGSLPAWAIAQARAEIAAEDEDDA
ncbi:hypothetical protein SAMN05216360_12926 [Methylobacterium phyllostachyos]|uniref:Uncharacterized protein n=1 Tax=Methylobacterium phyllostachyos TaxID=582672 RepID=A0A1H0KUU5_9HYPH|nr:hypothetical protein [Methylobacterium phyllostachyos]SDO59774.1 hypothetical protein SAMN05216360_12926 [Methylobacterium phyllostachyos]